MQSSHIAQNGDNGFHTENDKSEITALLLSLLLLLLLLLTFVLLHRYCCYCYCYCYCAFAMSSFVLYRLCLRSVFVIVVCVYEDLKWRLFRISQDVSANKVLNNAGFKAPEVHENASDMNDD